MTGSAVFVYASVGGFGRCLRCLLSMLCALAPKPPPNLSLNADAPRRACGPSLVAPVSLVRWASNQIAGEHSTQSGHRRELQIPDRPSIVR